MYFLRCYMPVLSTVRQFAENHQAFSQNSIRMLIFNEDQNGLAQSGAIVRIGRKVLIDESKFFAWIEAQNRKGT